MDSQKKQGNSRIKHVGSCFTIVPNSALNDPKISFRAKGVYAYLRSKPDDWEFRVPNITRDGTEGRDAVVKAIKELEMRGYIKREAFWDAESKKLSGWIWYIYEQPTTEDLSISPPEKQSNGFSVILKNSQSVFQGENNNTIHNNTDHNNVVEIFANCNIDIRPVLAKHPNIFNDFSAQEISNIARTLRNKAKKTYTSEEYPIYVPPGITP